MSPSSHYETTGLSVHFYQRDIAFTAGSPNTVTVTPRGNFQTSWLEYESLSFETKALGGFWGGKTSAIQSMAQVEWWMEQGVGLHVEVLDQAQIIRWEGFVDSVGVSLGGQVFTFGPLMAIGNRCIVSYAPLDTTSAEPVAGSQTDTAIGEDDASQRRYGIFSKYLSTGEILDAQATQLRDQYLSEVARPRTSRAINLSGGGSVPRVSLSLAGYVRTLTWPYSQTTTTGTINLSDKLAAVLDADPNGILGSGNALIEANTLQVQAWESKQRDGWSLIKELVGLGDTSNNRHLFMVGPEQHATYEAIPTEVEYRQVLSGQRQEIERVDGGLLEPWEVQAGKWIITPDILIGAPIASDLREDVRMTFAERVSYSAPRGLSVQDGMADSWPQMVAQQGLRGMRT